jgi:hypothetical protein
LSLVPHAHGFTLKEDPQMGHVKWNITLQPISR